VLALAVDSEGDPYVTGETGSADYPTTPTAFDRSHAPQRDAFVTKLDLSGRILVRKDAVPDGAQNFSFQAGGGLSPTTFQLDDDSDPTLSNTRAFDVAVGSGYSLGETQPAGWYLAKASCDDGSPVNNIDVAEGEVVTCTFMNSKNYPRPGGGSPFRVALVPAFRICNSPNATHAPPLNLPSCTPPTQASTLLTTSTTGKGAGFARFDVAAGNLATPTIDEADVGVRASITDVRNTSDGSDHEGQLILAARMTITDRANDPEGVASATVQRFTFSLPIDCQATVDATLGSSCDLETTLDTLVPGFAKEGKRAVIATGATVRDAGPDGTILPASGVCPPTCGTGDERTFLDSGLFLP
jgi:hypothetical protein